MTSQHTFAIVAYKESPFLQECINSLKEQSLPGEIILCTSTPSPYLENIAQKNNLPLFINARQSGIANDWNFALGKADAEFVTLAHQDDLYQPTYTQKVLESAELHKDALIIFSNYDEIITRQGTTRIRKNSLNFFVKKTLLRLFFRNKNHITTHKQRMLALGSPIGCPTVTFRKSRLQDFQFDPNFSINVDWKAWTDLARKEGSFVWIRETLVSHRIYAGSETSHGLAENRRQEEDLKMFEAIWPKKIARLINRVYCLSYKNNHN